MKFALKKYHEISDDRLVKVCKYRQGASCCKYIVFFEKPGKFYCVKKINELKDKIDSQNNVMRSKGDNCEGIPCAADDH